MVLNRPFEIGHSFSGPFRGTVILRGSIVTQRMIIVMIIILRNCRGALFDLRVLCLSFLGLRLSRCRYRCRSGSPTQQPCLHGDDQAGELLHAHQHSSPAYTAVTTIVRIAHMTMDCHQLICPLTLETFAPTKRVASG